MTVKELNTISNVFVECWTRERRIEWLEIKLKSEITILTANQNAIVEYREITPSGKKQNLKLRNGYIHSINEFFLEMKKLSRLEFFNDKSMEIDSYVFPNTRSWSHSKSNPWWQHNCFLILPNQKRSKLFSKKDQNFHYPFFKIYVNVPEWI